MLDVPPDPQPFELGVYAATLVTWRNIGRAAGPAAWVCRLPVRAGVAVAHQCP